MALPLNITSFGVGSDNLGEQFFIYFLSCFTARKLYLGDECLTEDIDKALRTDDMQFIVGELTNLLKDDDFMNYLEGEMVL